jgi:AcrR family transcriptional regulator
MTNDTDHSPSDTRRPRADAERNRRHIIETAMRLMAVDAECTLDEVVAKTGLGRTTVFRHFASRDELVTEVMKDVIDKFEVLLTSAKLDQGTAADALRRVVQLAGDFAERMPIMLTPTPLPKSPAIEARVTGSMERITDVFRRGQQAGEFRTDIPADWMFELFHAAMEAMFQRIGQGRDTVGNLERRVLQVVLDGLAAPVLPR